MPGKRAIGKSVSWMAASQRRVGASFCTGILERRADSSKNFCEITVEFVHISNSLRIVFCNSFEISSLWR